MCLQIYLRQLPESISQVKVPQVNLLRSESQVNSHRKLKNLPEEVTWGGFGLGSQVNLYMFPGKFSQVIIFQVTWDNLPGSIYLRNSKILKKSYLRKVTWGGYLRIPGNFDEISQVNLAQVNLSQVNLSGKSLR